MLLLFTGFREQTTSPKVKWTHILYFLIKSWWLFHEIYDLCNQDINSQIKNSQIKKKKKKNEIHTEGGASVELDYFTRYSINF